jgi:hypothetical protein
MKCISVSPPWLVAVAISTTTIPATLARAGQADARPKVESVSSIAKSARVDELLKLRYGVFEKRRLELFRDPAFVDELRQFPRAAPGSGPVRDFAIRVLLQWATDPPPSFETLERFIVIEEPQLRVQNRTAAGGGGSMALLRLLNPYQDFTTALDYLLLRALTRPTAEPWVYGALSWLFSQKPTHEPEVWLRLTLEMNDVDVTQHAAEQSLPLADPGRTLKALNAERAALWGQNKSLPKPLEALRLRLAKGK